MTTVSSSYVSKLENFRDYMLGKYKKLIYFDSLILARYINLYKEYRFWRKYAIFYHPFILYSYTNTLRYNVPDLHKSLDYSTEETVLFIDSGGFQAAKGKNVSQESVLEYIVRYGDAGVILDYPPIGGNDLQAIWEKHLELTRRNVDLVLKLYDKFAEDYGRRPLIYAALQGFSPRQLEKWADLVVKPMYETGLTRALGVGLVMSISHYDVMYIVRFVLDYLPETRLLHLFGIGDTREIGLLMELSQFFEYLSTDSSNGSQQIYYGMTYIPCASVKKIKQLKTAYYCPCPACQYYYRTKGHWPVEATGNYSTEAEIALYLHNLFWVLSWFTQISFQHTIYPLEKFFEIRGHDYDAYVYMMDKDYVSFYNRYCNRFTKYYRALAGGCRTYHGFF